MYYFFINELVWAPCITSYQGKINPNYSYAIVRLHSQTYHFALIYVYYSLIWKKNDEQLIGSYS